MKFPSDITIQEKKILTEVYKQTYAKNYSKGKERSKNIAKARFYEECFKIFCKKENVLSIREEWLNKKPIKISLKEAIDYKSYELNGKKFIVSTDKRILNKFSGSERNGLIRDMKDEYEQEILFKVKKEYGISLHPDMYYVIK